MRGKARLSHTHRTRHIVILLFPFPPASLAAGMWAGSTGMPVERALGEWLDEPLADTRVTAHAPVISGAAS